MNVEPEETQTRTNSTSQTDAKPGPNGAPETNEPPAPAPEPAKDRKAEPQDHIEKGLKHYWASDFKAAEEAYRLATEADPRSAEAYKGLGDALSELYRYDEAIAAYDRAAGSDCKAAKPDTCAEAHYGHGVVLYSLRRFAEAVECFGKVAKMFDDLEQKCRAASDHQAANKYEARSGDLHNDWGYSLLELKKYEEARRELETAIEKGRKYPYAYHSLATLLWAQGKYQEAMQYWEDAYYRYDGEVAFAEAEQEHWPGHFLNFGNMLHEVYGDLDRAEEMYLKTLELLPRSATTRIGLISLYVERAASVAGRSDAYYKARVVYDKARALLTERLAGLTGGDLDTLLALGDIYLAWNDYDGAERWQGEEAKTVEKYLKDALALDKERAQSPGYSRTAKPQTSLGVLYMHQKRYRQAISYFREALGIEPHDLILRSNLAEAYLRASQLEDAEREYQYILNIVPEHVESLIGLGEVYLARGEGNDPDMYDQAVTMFTAAVKLAQPGRGSKRLKKKELAKVLYLRAYARVKSFEGSKLWKDQRSLFFARDDFKLCFRTDPEFYLAQRAIDKIDKNLTAHAPQRWLEKFGPFVVLVSAGLIFFLAQWSYFYRENARLNADQYIFMTFGSLLLMIASSYLPQILKLKFAGLELEKSIVNQVTTLGTLGISKGV